MLTFLIILIIIAAIILVLIILAQNPKGGGLSSTFGGGGSQIIGARQTADFLEKATWYLAIGIIVVVIATNFFTPNTTIQEERQSRMSEQINEMANPIPQNPNTPNQIENANQ
ncbi:MAG: preprotein translocase subunit SecG [Bacteroidota bacterium]|nr:preprotein translocase subunit SecG [Bacteroidota bacterium]